MCVCVFSTSDSGLVAVKKAFFWQGVWLRHQHEPPNTDKTATTKPAYSLSAASALQFLTWGFKSVSELRWFNLRVVVENFLVISEIIS